MAVATTPGSTSALYSARLAERAQEEKFDPREIRLSEAGLCGRKQTLRALGYEGDEPDERSLSIFESGDEHEETIYHLWAEQYPRQVKRQVAVRTPYGTGHIDIWVAPLKHLVESKSTTEKSLKRLPMEHHVDQVTMYLHFWGRAHGATAEIAYRVKETGEIKSFPVEYNERRALNLIANLVEIQGAIEMTQEPLPIPADYTAFSFPCAWATGRCPFWQHCWGGAQTEVLKKKVIAKAPQLAADAQEYLKLRQRRQALEGQVAIIKAREDVLEGGFGSVLDGAQAGALVAGEVLVGRSRIPGRITYDGDAMLEAGVLSAAAIAPFRRIGAGYDRWTPKDLTAPKKSKAG
jgi:hypothetical protein